MVGGTAVVGGAAVVDVGAVVDVVLGTVVVVGLGCVVVVAEVDVAVFSRPAWRGARAAAGAAHAESRRAPHATKPTAAAGRRWRPTHRRRCIAFDATQSEPPRSVAAARPAAACRPAAAPRQPRDARAAATLGCSLPSRSVPPVTPTSAARRRAQLRRARRLRQRRRRTVTFTVLACGIALGLYLATGGGGPADHAPSAAHATARPHLPPSIEAGVQSWSLPSPLSREDVVADGTKLLVVGGLDAPGASLAGVETIEAASGKVSSETPLATPVHDAAAATLPDGTFVFGGGSPTTVATVQPVPPAHLRTPAELPAPRSDCTAVTLRSGAEARRAVTAYVIGGYAGSVYDPTVLATTDGSHFAKVADLPVPVRYPAVAAVDGRIYVFGGEVPSPGAAVAATNDIQMIDPATHRAEVVGHLPVPLYGAAGFVFGGVAYVAGGQSPVGTTLTSIDAYVPAAGKVLHAGLLPQAVAFGGSTTLGSGTSAVGYIVGGEVTNQSGANAAGQASGQLSTVISLRPSRFGGAAGTAAAGSPFHGTLLIADRGSDRLLAINPERHIIWRYPSPSMPPPPGGFYFPDDAFFIRHGTAIISNQEGNDTIVEIGYPSGRLLWQYGHPRVPGSAPGYLDQPDDAYLLKSGTVTVADASNNRILFISSAKHVIGQIGNGTDAHLPGQALAYPNGDTPLANGDLLVSEINGSWIDEYTPAGRVVWSVSFPTVNYPSDPQQLGPDLYLMTDYNPPGEGRVLEFTRQGRIVWGYDALGGEAALKEPSLAERLPNGLLMVTDDYRDRVVVIDPRIDAIVWQYGLTDVPGTAPGLLTVPDGFDLLAPGGATPTHPQTG